MATNSNDRTGLTNPSSVRQKKEETLLEKFFQPGNMVIQRHLMQYLSAPNLETLRTAANGNTTLTTRLQTSLFSKPMVKCENLLTTTRGLWDRPEFYGPENICLNQRDGPLEFGVDLKYCEGHTLGLESGKKHGWKSICTGCNEDEFNRIMFNMCNVYRTSSMCRTCTVDYKILHPYNRKAQAKCDDSIGHICLCYPEAEALHLCGDCRREYVQNYDIDNICRLVGLHRYPNEVTEFGRPDFGSKKPLTNNRDISTHAHDPPPAGGLSSWVRHGRRLCFGCGCLAEDREESWSSFFERNQSLSSREAAEKHKSLLGPIEICAFCERQDVGVRGADTWLDGWEAHLEMVVGLRHVF